MYFGASESIVLKKRKKWMHRDRSSGNDGTTLIEIKDCKLVDKSKCNGNKCSDGSKFTNWNGSLSKSGQSIETGASTGASASI